jgi:hypothetical protein
VANKKILVIGGVAAGPSAASKAKRIDPDADVNEKVVSMVLVEYHKSLKV